MISATLKVLLVPSADTSVAPSEEAIAVSGILMGE